MKFPFLPLVLLLLLIISTPSKIYSQCELQGGQSYDQSYILGTSCLNGCSMNCSITISGGVVNLIGTWDLSSIDNIQIIIEPDGGLLFEDGESIILDPSASITIQEGMGRSQDAFVLAPMASETEIKIDKGPNNSFDGGDFATLNEGSGVLPVSLTFFEALGKGSSIALTWQTATELNSAKFIIETSAQGEVFQRIGEIAGAGTTTEPQNYSFTHHTPSTGINYYRLKQVDFDGTFEYSKVVAIEAAGTQDIFAFPNPAREKITLQYDQSKGAGNIQLLDGLGRRINASIAGYAGNYELTLPESLARGTYWLKVERGGKVQTLPVVKE